jgi:hypothetical protein
MDAMAASSKRRGSSRSSMLVKPSALANSKFASEKRARTPNLGFQDGTRTLCAWAAAVTETAVNKERLDKFTGFISPAICKISPLF